MGGCEEGSGTWMGLCFSFFQWKSVKLLGYLNLKKKEEKKKGDEPFGNFRGIDDWVSSFRFRFHN